MLSELDVAEWLIVAGGRTQWINQSTQLQSINQSIHQSILLFQNAHFLQIIEADPVQILSSILSLDDQSINTSLAEIPQLINSSINKFLTHQSTDQSTREKELLVLLTGASLIQLFVQCNFTGPSLSQIPLINQWSTATQQSINQSSLHHLALDGEDLFEGVTHPFLLDWGNTIINSINQSTTSLETLNVWKMRCLSIHQSIMETNTQSIKVAIDQCAPLVIEQLKRMNTLKDSLHQSINSQSADQSINTLSIGTIPLQDTIDLLTRLIGEVYCECSHLLLSYWKYDQSMQCLEDAQKCVGLIVDMTGIMGKRTRYQVEQKSQLIVRAVVNDQSTNQSINQPDVDDIDDLMPARSSIESDVLLAKPELQQSEDESVNQSMIQGRLNATQRAILLSIAKNLRKNQSSDHSINQQLIAFMSAILDPVHQRSWSIEADSLMIRASIELHDNYRQDRALDQMEILSLNTFKQSINQSQQYSLNQIARVRLFEVYSSGWLPFWNISLLVAQAFEKMGLLRSALDIYASINQIEGMIEMNVALDRKHEAEELIRSRLAISETPKLYCLLGMILNDTSMYEKAWEISNQQYPRAQRLLAKAARDKNLHEKAITHSELALAINPVFPMEWFGIGVSSMELKQYDRAVQAFTKSVHYDPEYAPAWNNLAAAHLELGSAQHAFQALEQANRLRFDSWKQWENYLTCAMSLGEWSKAMSAVERIITIKKASLGKDKDIDQGLSLVDERVLNTLTAQICVLISENTQDSWLVEKWQAVLDSLTQTITTDPSLWMNVANLAEARQLLDKEIEAREKAYRCALLPVPASHPSVLARYSAFQMDQENLKPQPGQIYVWTSHAGMRERAAQLLIDLMQRYLKRDVNDDVLAAQLAADSFIDRWNRIGAAGQNEKERSLMEQIQQLRGEAAAKLASRRAPAPTETKKTSVSSYASMWR